MGKKNEFVKIEDKSRKGLSGKKKGGWLALWQKLALLVLGLLTVLLLIGTLNIFLADVSFNLGEAAARYGFYAAAVGHYQDAIALNPREPRYHRELAWILANSGEVGSAVKEAEAAYRLNPQNSLTLRSLITTYKVLAKGDSQYQKRAEKLIQETIDQQPTNPELYLEQAKIFLEATKSAQARESLKKALKLKEDYVKAREFLQTLPQNPN
jgi:tetratricopeptide (TPR) repeat protein